MSYFGPTKLCKHKKRHEDCAICHTKVKPIDWPLRRAVKNLLNQPIGGVNCACQQKRVPMTRSQAMKKLMKSVAKQAKTTRSS